MFGESVGLRPHFNNTTWSDELMKFKSRMRLSAIAQALASGALAGTAVAPAWAQQTGTEAAPAKVEITGSRILRADSETPSPVQVISADDLKKSGYTSIAQVLGNITANGQGTLSQGFSGAFAAGAQAVSLRGLNTSATLVLIDGHRVAPNSMFDDGQRSIVDIGAIPFDAIERVEVLKDGASAQYGSDAMAGVVNVILKKNFTGTTINAEGGTSTEGGGATKHVSITHGFGDLDSDGYNGFLSLEYRHQNPISLASRFNKGEWSSLNFTGSGGYDWTPGVPNPARSTPLVPGSVYLYNPNGGAPSAANTTFVSGPCSSWAMLNSGGCASAPLGNLQPETENLDILASFTKKFSGDWQLALKASLFESDVTVIGGGAGYYPSFPTSIGPAVGVVPATGPFIVNYPQAGQTGNVTLPNGDQIFGYDTSGPRPGTAINSKNYRISGDLTGSIGDWDTSTSVTLSRNRLLQNSIGVANGAALEAALNSPSDPYSVTGGNSLTNVASVYPSNTSSMFSELADLEFHATRTLMRLAGGDLGFSVGAAYLYNKVYAPPLDLYAAGLIPNASGLQFVEGQQSDTSLFTEIAAPLTKTFEVDAHARYDHFALSGQNNSFTPAFGFKWTPTQVATLRGTLSTGFRAPNVAETGKAGLVFAGGNDTQLCPDASNPAVGTPVPSCLSTAVFETGSSTLKPEKSVSATLGVILEPVRGWSSTFDLYDIKIKNQIYTPPPTVGPTDVRSQVPVSTQCYTETGTAACTVPGGPNGILLYEQVAYENTNDTEVRGWELETHYKWKLGNDLGTLYTGVDWSHTMSYILNVGGVGYQLAGTHGPELIGGDTSNPKDRVQITATYDTGPWDITATENYISGYVNSDPSYVGSLGLDNTCSNNLDVYSGVQFSGYTAGFNGYPSNFCKTASFATTDLTVRYIYSKQLTLHFAVNNLTNRQPPFDAATYGGSPYQYNPSMHMSGAIGRFIQGGLTYSF